MILHGCVVQQNRACVSDIKRNQCHAAYIDAELLVESQEQHGITLRGPTRPIQGWQAQVAGGYTIDQFEVDWAQQRGRCPQGQWSAAW